MAKLTKKASIGIIVAVLVVVACVSVFLLTRPPEIERPRELYELSFDYKPGESYTYITTSTTETMGQKQEQKTESTMEILEVKDNEITLRTRVITQIVSAPQMPEEITIVSILTQTNKGELISFKIESIKPPKFKVMTEQFMDQLTQQKSMQPTYPTRPLPIGGKWVTPIEFEIEIPPFSFNLTGESKNKIASKEKITTKAGEFNCLKLTSEINVVGEGIFGKNQTITMEISGNETRWVDQKNGAQIKSEVHTETKMEMGTAMTMQAPSDEVMELIEYKQA
jgi:hypothetical protein